MADLAPIANGASKGDDSSGVIQWEIDKDSITKKNSFSPSIDVGGIPWSLCACRENDHLAIFLHLMDGDYFAESVEVTYEFKLINHDDEENIVTSRKETSSFEKEDAWGISLIKWENVIDEKKGYMKNNKLTLQGQFCLSNIIGLRLKSKDDLFGLIRWEVEKDSITEKHNYSPSIEVGGIPWSLNVCKENDHVAIFLHLMDGDYFVESVEVTYEFKLINHDDEEKTITSNQTKSFEKEHTWGISKLIKWENEDKGYTKDNKFTLQCQFCLSNIIGLRLKSNDDIFGSIRCEVDIDAVTEKENFSPSIEVGGIPWSLSVRKQNDYLAIFLNSMDGDYFVQSVGVTYEIKLINHNGNAEAITATGIGTFEKESYSGYSEFIQWDDLIDKEKGFIKDNKLTLQVRFWLSNFVGLRLKSEDDLFAIIRLELDKESILEDDIFTPSIEVGGIPWSINVRERGEEYLGVRLYLIDGDYIVQSVDVKYEFKLINHKDDAETITRKSGHLFKKKYKRGWSKFVRWNEAIDQENGFIKDNKITLKARLCLSNIIGFRAPSREYIANSSAGSFMLGQIRLEVHKDFITNEEIESIPINVGGMRWRIALKKMTTDQTYFSVFLRQSDGDYEMQSVDVAVEYNLINQLDDERTFTRKAAKTHKHDYRTRGLAQFEKWNNVIDDARGRCGFIKNGKFALHAEFSLSNFIGSRKLRRLDFTAENKTIQDVTLIIEGKKLFVCKKLLSIHSPVFHTMFYSDYKEANQEEIKLDDINYKEFIELLNVIYPPSKKITEDTADCLLKLGDFFDIDWIVCKCEQFLITYSQLEITSKLILASQYRLSCLQDYCLDRLNTAHDLKNLKNSNDFSNLSDEIKVAIVDKLCG